MASIGKNIIQFNMIDNFSITGPIIDSSIVYSIFTAFSVN